MADLSRKQQTAENLLVEFRHVIIAFSGGVDSTLLAKLARSVLGKPNALAVTADSPSLAREDLREAESLARQLDLEYLVIKTAEVKRAEYQANTQARCYFCKQTLFEELEKLARLKSMRAVCYGVLADDQIQNRPGHRAALEYSVCAPLQQAGFTKAEVRALAKKLGLPNWDKPQNACLSSRIPHGELVTIGKLTQIEEAESILKVNGFRQVRVRHLGGHARIEVGADEVFRFNDAALCFMIDQSFSALGFTSIGVSRAGYREGGANAPVDEVSLSAFGRC